MNTYIADFIERNKEKPFITNLSKYVNLSDAGQAKVISSMLTHLLIDQETGYDNRSYIIDVMSILNEKILYQTGDFLAYIEQNI